MLKNWKTQLDEEESVAQANILRSRISDFLQRTGLQPRQLASNVLAEAGRDSDGREKFSWTTMRTFLDGLTDSTSIVCLPLLTYLEKHDPNYFAREIARKQLIYDSLAHSIREGLARNLCTVEDEDDDELEQLKRRVGYVSGKTVVKPSPVEWSNDDEEAVRDDDPDWECSRCRHSNLFFENECERCDAMRCDVGSATKKGEAGGLVTFPSENTCNEGGGCGWGGEERG